MEKNFALLAATILLFLVNGNYVYGQSDIQRIRKLIIDTPKINVANTSIDPDGDIITPKKSVGYSGNGADRRELFEERRRLTKALEKYVAFNPNADALFPGAIIQGKSLPDGVLTPINPIRNPLKITVTDLVGSNPLASYSKKVEHPDLSTVTDAIHGILSQNLNSQQPAKITYSETSVKSIEQAFLKLGASFSWATGNISGSFQTSASSFKTSLMIRFVQSYYTVSCETPSTPESFISKKTKFENFANYVGLPSDKNPPTYVSSVTYGRELWMLIESNYEASEVRATLNAAFSSGFTSGNLDLSAGQKKLLNESNIQILILGGAGRPAVEVVAGDHVSKLKNYLVSGANYSKSSPGVIISYVVRYLKDNDTARVSSSTDYTIKTSEPAPEAITLTSMRVTWRTQGDNKDWNSQPVIDVFDRVGRHVGHIDCCSADRRNDEWNNGRTETRNLNILISGLKKEDLSNGRFSAGRNPVGNDDWDYEATVEFIFSNGERINHRCSGRNSCGASW